MSSRKLVKDLRKLRRISLTEVKHSIIRSMARDSDTESQRHTLSLKCPISQTRIKDPCRFVECDHYNCFDATSFLSSVDAVGSASLRCPICERDFPRKSLAIDLYFESVLRRAPATTDEVYLQSDGGWHTATGQHMSLREASQVAIRSDYHGPIVVQFDFGTFFSILSCLVFIFTVLAFGLLLAWTRLKLLYTM
ncbi:E3 SUMO-protein ligase SIZ1 OS=Saccharomyces cerevisiae (strain ATCC 204508 / S288c) GN=SIZ1 PE=1 SV=1 [Rhizoctonia solani AG-1 IB]|uniref:E3 SUMO-protein ligase SIZ1 n=1 Tax=Thanatephorus cucumeris (strain AG1-IB / isolate 7/3/14) TaxID=1108050 RepID=A0A0B7FR27_THACB|nr:E3 SUMO-protein ligase SIZ1 OS=Saccharomyces cerevisiae (strain ATCC 204508 / S288c) GN=SIZ1 PE=1 SV=1 [Rhizoctonia solani AG-1 IB]